MLCRSLFYVLISCALPVIAQGCMVSPEALPSGELARQRLRE